MVEKKRYICKQFVIAAIKTYKWKSAIDMNHACAIIMCEQEEDVAPIVRGKWLRNYMQFECSKCGILINEKNAKPIYELIWCSEITYCPRCGAVMDLED